MQRTSPAALACARRLDLPWKLRKLYLPRRGRGKHQETQEIGIAQTPLPFAEANKDAPLVTSPGVELISTIPRVSHRVVNRFAGSRGKSDAKITRRNRKESAKPRVSRYFCKD